MKTTTIAALLATHCLVGALGFGAGIYTLPILTAPPAPTEAEVTSMSAGATYHARFKKDLKDSDALHWGEGKVSISAEAVTLIGELAPGPDYRLYFSPEFVETEADFLRLKSQMSVAGSVKTFENFVVKMPQGLNPAEFNTVVVWCESFGQFITAAKYQ